MGSLDWPSCRHLNADQAAAGGGDGVVSKWAVVTAELSYSSPVVDKAVCV